MSYCTCIFWSFFFFYWSFFFFLQSLPDALSTLCEILSSDEEGGPARIPLDQFQPLYSFLATVDGSISKEQVASVINFLKTEA